MRLLSKLIVMVYTITVISVSVVFAEQSTQYSKYAAIGMVSACLETQLFSRQGLIDKLMLEGYDYTDAVYAVNYVVHSMAEEIGGTDNNNCDSIIEDIWNSQAFKSAQIYLLTHKFSADDLIEYLEVTEKFTHEQSLTVTETLEFAIYHPYMF